MQYNTCVDIVSVFSKAAGEKVESFFMDVFDLKIMSAPE